MSPKSQHTHTALTRRRLLQGTLGGIAGLATWQGWPRLQVAMAQKGDTCRADDVGDAHHPGADVV